MRRKGLPSTRRFGATDDERDPEFLDVIRGFVANQDELAAIIDMPEYSLFEIRDHLRKCKSERKRGARVAEWLQAIRPRVARGWSALALPFVRMEGLRQRGDLRTTGE